MTLSDARAAREAAEATLSLLRDLRDGEPLLPVAVEDAIDYDDYESLTVSNTAVPLTAAKIGNHSHAYITVETQAIRYRLDGRASPTATDGHVKEPGDAFPLWTNASLRKVRFIRRDGADATLKISYGNRLT